MEGGKKPFAREASRDAHEKGYKSKSALLRKGFVPGDVVLVDYSGGQACRKLEQERGVFVDAGKTGALVVNFDDPALGQKSLRFKYTVTKVDDPTVTHINTTEERRVNSGWDMFRATKTHLIKGRGRGEGIAEVAALWHAMSEAQKEQFKRAAAAKNAAAAKAAAA